jgi:hypothetical protein
MLGDGHTRWTCDRFLATGSHVDDVSRGRPGPTCSVARMLGPTTTSVRHDALAEQYRTFKPCVTRVIVVRIICIHSPAKRRILSGPPRRAVGQLRIGQRQYPLFRRQIMTNSHHETDRTTCMCVCLLPSFSAISVRKPSLPTSRRSDGSDQKLHVPLRWPGDGGGGNPGSFLVVIHLSGLQPGGFAHGGRMSGTTGKACTSDVAPKIPVPEGVTDIETRNRGPVEIVTARVEARQSQCNG